MTDRDEPLLVIIPLVGMAIEGERAFLDIKAVEGLFLYAQLWPGRVLCLSRTTVASAITFGKWYDRASLPFDVAIVPDDVTAEALFAQARGAAVILAGADSVVDLKLVDVAGSTPVVFTIELTLKTRLDLTRYSPGTTWQKIKTSIWLCLQEPRRRRALRRAAGMQANGTPAFDRYRQLNRNPLLYFDTRLKTALAIRPDQAAAKADALRDAPALRLAFSGRLEPIKGVEQLVPVLAATHRQGVTHATLDIYGVGSLRETMERQVMAAGLGSAIRFHGSLPYDEALVPTFKTDVDLFLCCHPQADPSCTYLETLGCGVPIAGYRNAAFAGVLNLGNCGVGVPVGDIEGLASEVVRLDRDRAALGRLTRGAAAVATEHLFEKVFAERVAHLRAVCLR